MNKKLHNTYTVNIYRYVSGIIYDIGKNNVKTYS